MDKKKITIADIMLIIQILILLGIIDVDQSDETEVLEAVKKIFKK